MGKSNIPLIVLLILLLISGFIAVGFYTKAQKLFYENESLKKEKDKLLAENEKFKDENKVLTERATELENRWREIQIELSKLERRNRELLDKYNQVKNEKDKLEEQLKKVSEAAVSPTQRLMRAKPETTPEYWAEVVREKAELGAQLEELKKELLDSKSEIANLDKKNKELSIKIDQLTKEKERAQKELVFKERTLQLMSKDLVNEREARQTIAEELAKLRDENMELKQEIILANQEKSRLQQNLKEALEKREDLEEKVSEVEKILKEKSLLFTKLREELGRALKGDLKKVELPPLEESSAVQLPPIVVKPEEERRPALSLAGKKIQGSILAVNERDRFVIIDIGEDSGVVSGTQFDIFRGNTPIGRIEVIETRKEISAADIKDVEAGYSIKEGDRIVSK
jgi:chromosome segregation protein